MTVVKTNVRNTQFSVTQHWTSENIEEIEKEFDALEREYPSPGYGTCLYGTRLDPTGMLWHATVYRSKSCD